MCPAKSSAVTRPDRQRELARQRIHAADMVGVMVAEHDRRKAPPLPLRRTQGA
jgi:hypothetical protein